MRRAQLRTESSAPEIVAAALVPDNTEEMKTKVDGDTIETTVMRETTGGLRSTVDDYVVNLSVAERV
ncbi:MAG TPA: KEOPS complex subunit Pcc1, partial [Halococcus sp.]|nr:KEOPS complex subunit Pcc1 [Halococcus sp.]